MEYAVIRTGGKQYKVSLGDVIEIDYLALPPNATHVFDDVLLYVSENGKSPMIGKPVVSNITVKATVLGDKKGEKIRVSRFQAKSRHRRTVGHRSIYSQIRIDQVGAIKAKKT